MAEKHTELAAAGSIQSPGGTTVSNFHKESDSQIELAEVTPGKVRLMVRDDKGDFLIVSDGARTWTYESRHKQYTEELGTPWKASGESRSAQNGEGDVLRQYDDFLLNRFRSLPKYLPVASFEKESWVKLGRDKVDCYVVKIQTPEFVHELWVDKSRFVILRFRQTPLRPQEGIAMQTTVTVSMREANVNAELPESQFKFTPPEKATKVQSLTPTEKSR